MNKNKNSAQDKASDVDAIVSEREGNDRSEFKRALEDLIKTVNSKDEKIAVAMGYDCGINGADEKNCHFSLFTTSELTKAWEQGKKKADEEKAC